MGSDDFFNTNGAVGYGGEPIRKNMIYSPKNDKSKTLKAYLNINFEQKDGVVVTSFSELLKSIWNKNINLAYINPRKFKRAFGLKNTQFL